MRAVKGSLGHSPDMWAENIFNGYLKDNTLRVYFTDGMLEVHSKKFRLAKCKPPRSSRTT